jgi:hypothetical protein
VIGENTLASHPVTASFIFSLVWERKTFFFFNFNHFLAVFMKKQNGWGATKNFTWARPFYLM